MASTVARQEIDGSARELALDDFIGRRAERRFDGMALDDFEGIDLV